MTKEDLRLDEIGFVKDEGSSSLETYRFKPESNSDLEFIIQGVVMMGGDFFWALHPIYKGANTLNVCGEGDGHDEILSTIRNIIKNNPKQPVT